MIVIILPLRFKKQINRKLHISYEDMPRHNIESISNQSRKQVSSATAPTAALLKPRPLVAEPAPDVELADEELELALSVAEPADEDAEVLLAVVLAEELEPEDCEAVDDVVSESDDAEASEVLLDAAEPLPVVEGGAATATSC